MAMAVFFLGGGEGARGVCEQRRRTARGPSQKKKAGSGSGELERETRVSQLTDAVGRPLDGRRAVAPRLEQGRADVELEVAVDGRLVAGRHGGGAERGGGDDGREEEARHRAEVRLQ